MPRVPTYQGDQVRSGPLRIPRQRTVPSPDVYGARFGAALGHAAEVVDKIAEEQRQRADDLTVTTAERQFNDLYRVGLLSEDRGPQGSKGLATMQGIEPRDKYENNVKEWDLQAEEIVKAAKTPEQRVRLEAMRNQQRARYLETATRHVSAEYAKYDTGETQALLISSKETAAAAAGTDGGLEVVDEQLNRQIDIVERRGNTIGLLSDAQKYAYIAQLRSETHTLAIEKLIASDQAMKAEAYFKRVMQPTAAYPKGEILESQATPLRAKLQTGTTEQAAYEIARTIWAEQGVKADDLETPVKTAELHERAHAMAGDDRKKGEQAVRYLTSMEVALNTQRRNVVDSYKSTLFGAVNDGKSMVIIRSMEAFQTAPKTIQDDVQKAAQDRDDREESRRRAAAAEGRAEAGEARARWNFQEGQRQRASEGVYWQLSNPQVLSELSPGELQERITQLTPEQGTQLVTKYNAIKANESALQSADLDMTVFKEAVAKAGYEWVKATTHTEEQTARLGNMLRAVEAELAAEQAAKKRKLGPNEQREVVQRVIDRKVIVAGGWYGETEYPQAMLIKDDLGRATVPWEHIPKAARILMRNFILSEPTAAGVAPTRGLKEEEIDARYAQAMKRAYAYAISGSGVDAWQAILRDAVNARKDVGGRTTRTPVTSPTRGPAPGTPGVD